MTGFIKTSTMERGENHEQSAGTVLQRSISQAFLKVRKDIDPETWSLGKQAYHNKIKFGHSNWYDWRIANLGTKWNAYSFGETDTNTMSINTVWSCSMPVMTKLSEMFPDVQFNYAWADEDFGNNVGEVELQGGERTYENIPPRSRKKPTKWQPISAVKICWLTAR